MEDWTIKEDFELPSKGKVYTQQVNPKISLRSMTTEEEMRRLGHSPYVYKMFSDIIDECLIDKPGISTYDLCLGDYQYLFYKLRIVTYGADYAINNICPGCGESNKHTINLDTLKLNTYNESVEKILNFQLPVSKKLITIKLQTPRMLDEIEQKTKSQNSNSADNIESAILFNVMSLIDTVDGVAYDDTKKELFVRRLPMRDTNKILQNGQKLITAIGLETTLELECPYCKQKYKLALPITGEFFRPAEDD